MKLPSPKTTFLVCYDYGTGGTWGLVDAPSADEITRRFPGLKVILEDPPWLTKMTRSVFDVNCKRAGFHWDIDHPPDIWLRALAQDSPPAASN